MKDLRDSTLQLADFHLVPRRRIWHKHPAQFPPPSTMDENRMPNTKKIRVPNRVALATCISIVLVCASLAQSQTATPETQPTPGVETSPTPSQTAATPQAEEKTPSQPASTPVDSTAQPPPLPADSDSTTPSEPSATPGANLVPPAAGPGAVPSPTPKPLPPQTVQALDQQFQDSLRIRRVHPKELLYYSLMDAVRIALYQNSDIRLAVEDAQLAKGALVKAGGNFDSKISAVVAYAKSFTNPAEGQAATPGQVREIVNQSLAGVFKTLAANPGAANNITGLIDQSTSSAAKNSIAQSINVLFASFDVSKELRNGMTFDVEYGPDLLDENDQPTWPPIKHDLKVSVSLPLTKLGRISNDADEMAARIDYEASLLNLSHAATKAALDTVQAYWKASSALEKFYLSDRAFRVSDALLSLSQELVRADSIPASDLSLSEAKRAEALASRSNALLAVFTSGAELATTIGLRTDQLKKLPLAYETFPSISKGKLAALNSEVLMDIALARRFDRAAALKGIESKRLLTEKARIDMRPDLKLKAGVGVAIIDNSATNNGSGYGLQPEFELGIGFNYPPANHTKKGALISAQADLDKSILSMETVSRSIATDILVSVDTLKELDQQISDSNLSVNYYTKSLSDLRERLRLGASTLLDTIQAEERLTSAATSAVSAKASLAEEIAKLRFETATLISRDVAYRIPGFPKPVESLKISRTSFTSLPDRNEQRGPLISDRNYEPGHRSSPRRNP
jgi:outer membrane protein TolC